MREGSIFHSNLLNYKGLKGGEGVKLKGGEGVKPTGIYFHAHRGIINDNPL